MNNLASLRRQNISLPLIFLGLVIIVPVLLAWFAPYDPLQTSLSHPFQMPSSVYWLGTDELGRDVWSRVLVGGRQTVLIASGATLIAAGFGLGLGLLGGLTNTLDALSDTLINVLLAVPGLVIALVMLTLIGHRVQSALIIATAAMYIGTFARVVRGEMLAVLSSPYVGAAYALGASRRHILLRHVSRGIRPVVLAYTGVIFSYAIVSSAALRFLGLGGDPGMPDWGAMIAAGRAALRLNPWISFAPGAGIILLVLAVNALTDRMNRQSV